VLRWVKDFIEGLLRQSLADIPTSPLDVCFTSKSVDKGHKPASFKTGRIQHTYKTQFQRDTTFRKATLIQGRCKTLRQINAATGSTIKFVKIVSLACGANG
jgi:hypothetical protein